MITVRISGRINSFLPFSRGKASNFCRTVVAGSHLLRNVGIVAHIDAGKTTTSEQMLYLSGATKSVGRVDDGDTVMDFLPQEKERGITISSAAISFGWNKHTINLIDTPGHVDFTVEVERSARVLDGAVLVVDAVAGVQAQTQTVWKQTRKQSIPAIAFVNKMDREGASLSRAVTSMVRKLGITALPIQYPLGSDKEFQGVVDLITMSKLTWPVQNKNGKRESACAMEVTKLEESDAEFEAAIEARTAMVEAIALTDETLMERYLSVSNQIEITPGDLIPAIRKACLECQVVPVLCGASLRGQGIEALLNSIVTFLPSPLDRPPSVAVHPLKRTKVCVASDSKDLCALAFKVVHDPSRGPIVFVRTYSGTMTSKQVLFNSSKRCKERIQQLLKVSADEFDMLESVDGGQVACLIGLKHTVTGDTLVGDKSPLEGFVLDGLQVPEAVYSVAIEPEKSSQQTELEEALRILQMEDPSLRVEINKECGQLLLHGIGELHIEITCDKLFRSHGIQVTTGRAYVAYRECIQLFPDDVVEDRSNSCSSKEPLRALESEETELSNGEILVRNRNGTLVLEKTHIYDRAIGGKRLYAGIVGCVGIKGTPVVEGEADPAGKDKKKGNLKKDNKATDSASNSAAPIALEECLVTVDENVKKALTSDEFNSLVEGFKAALSRGPTGYPVVGLHVHITQIHRSRDSSPGAIRACAATFVDSLLRNSSWHTLLEPLMTVEIDLPSEFVGDVLNDLTVRRRGVVKEVTTHGDQQAQQLSTITAEVPFSTMIGYATTLRSQTQGEGSFSMEYKTHVPVDSDVASSEMNR